MKVGRDQEMPGSPCPKCGKMLDTARGLDHERPPKKRDITVCINCSTLLEFQEDLSLAKLTEEVYDGLAPHQRTYLIAVQAAAAVVKAKHKRNKR